MRRSFLFVPLILVACASPQEQCISQATRDLGILNGLLGQTQANVNRGFALQDVTRTRTVNKRCEIELPGQEEKGYVECPQIEEYIEKVPVSIDLEAERLKLQSQLEKRRELQAKVDIDIQQCRLLYPQ